jgi:hypothetical protein
MNLIISAILYVSSDPFFWPSMGITTMIGIFIGAVIYNGDVTEVKKMIASLICYAVLISTVNLTRVLPDLPIVANSKPLGSIITIFIVTIFYLLGTFIGVKITKKAHKGTKSK